ncbi:MAG: IS3 family transposase [Nitrospira sp.]|nr:IS3 family transposase [Nitrospira sp.]
MDSHIQAIFDEHQQRYRAPQIAKTLSQEGHMCSENRIERRMQVLHLRTI